MTETVKTGSGSAANVITNMTQTQCGVCAMDTSAREIVFTETGCNFCDTAREMYKEVQYNYTGGFPPNLKQPHQNYDILIGLSGGVDSSYALHLAVKMGLRPLCFSIDTGYNKPEADENIMRLVEGLQVPFFRYTINLDNFKALQAAFMQAGVKNIEIPTDHVLMAASYEMADKYGIKTIISGGNVATESIMPPSWGHNARDLTHIKSIYHGSYEGLPTCGIWKWNWYRWVKGIHIVYLLDYVHYDRKEAERMLEKEYGFKSTGEKHEENYFTWWFQNYYLFEKFGIDKRKAHYSSMIVSGQMTREDAIERLAENPVYPRLGLEQRVLRYPSRDHESFPMDKWYSRIAYFVRLCRS